MKFPSFALLAAALLLSPLATADAAGDAVENESATGRLVHGLSAFGDLKYPAEFEHFDYVDPDAPKGGAISLQPHLEPVAAFDSVNPFILAGEAPQGIDDTEPRSLVYDSLMVRAWDEPDAVYGLVAKSAEVAEDKTSVVFHLRPEAKWHDGTAITAADVAFTFDALKNRGHPRYQIVLRDVESAEALDDRTVRFNFSPEGALRDLPLIVAQLPILSKTYYEDHDFEQTTLDPPLTSGPYRFGRIDAPRSITFVRVPDYWARDLPVSRGRFNFDEIRYEFYRDRTTALEAFLAGAYDLREEFTSKTWATEYKGHGIDRGLILRDVFSDHRPSGAQAFFINMRREKFADARVRAALDYAFDFEWTNRAIFYGAYERTYSMFANSSLAPSGPPSEAELALLEPWRGQIPDNVFGPPYAPPVSDGSGEDRTNLRKASMLLREAGWRVRNGVLVDETGTPFTIEFMASDPGFNRIVLPYIRALNRLGIQADVRVIDSAQYQGRLERFDFDITTVRQVMDMTPGVEMRNLWSSQAADINGSNNIGGVASPAVDALVDAIVSADSRESLDVAVMALDRVIMHSHYVVPQWYKGSHTMAWWDKLSRPAEKPAFQRGVIDLWWVDEEKAARLKAAKEFRHLIGYILRRLLLIVPTLFMILVITFGIVQVMPGGPVERVIAQITGQDSGDTSRIGGGGGDSVAGRQVDMSVASGETVKYRGAQGLDPKLIERIEKQFGFDKPAHERFAILIWDYMRFDFGDSFFKGRPVVDLIIEKLPVSISLGLWATLISYLISIPMGIRKAVRDGSTFDIWTSAVIVVGYAIPAFLFAILLIVLFAGGTYWDIFPLRGLVSANFDELSWWGQVTDYLWHITLPVIVLSIGGFASLTMLTKNSFLDEIGKQYVVTARAKGLTEHRVLYGHVFRNAMIIVISGLPGTLLAVLLTGSILIEFIFSLDGMGLLGFEALIARDYPVVFGTLFIFTLLGMLVNLLGDLVKVWVDPRIDFESRQVR